ncbi:MAG TPA: hypothetical protein VIV11_01670 [Kofleriaceae bacterium]
MALALVIAACETPPLTLRYSLTDGPSQQCISENTGNETTNCEDITMTCDAVLSIRIVPPDRPEVPYVTVCEPLRGNRNLCSIAGVDLPQPAKPIPEQVLEVQMAVFPRDAAKDLDDDGDLDCPRIEFGVDGLPVTETVDCYQDPVACEARPAIGGRAFYHPGDAETHITLGCTELELLNAPSCSGATRTNVIATVNEFEYPVSVDLAIASGLFVSIGEPRQVGPNTYVLDSSTTHLLPRAPGTLPTWTDSVPLELMSSYCIEVLEDAPLATRTLTCRSQMQPLPDPLDATGLRLKPETLSTILRALYGPNPQFPSKGLVVGIVLDQSFAPVPNAVVDPTCPASPCTVKYLSADRLSFGGTSTSSNGIWVSEDAPYKSTFTRFGQVLAAFGGLVENKVTTVVLQEPSIGGGM